MVLKFRFRFDGAAKKRYLSDWHNSGGFLDPSAADLMAGIELTTCLEDTYWSTLDAKAGRLRPDHFLRTFPLTRCGANGANDWWLVAIP